MRITRRRHLLAMTLVAAFLFMVASPAFADELQYLSNSPPGLTHGPYLDKVVYKVIEEDDQRVLALQSGEIDAHDSFLEPASIPILAADPDIEIMDDTLRSGYGHIKIKCDKAPFNWTSFRRAFNFAYDKVKVKADIFQGLSELLDSPVPLTHTDWNIEDELTPHYYNPEVTIGNQLLNDTGWEYDPVSGYRLDPNGNTVHEIVINYSPDSPAIAGGCAQVGVDALRALGFRAVAQQADFNTYLGTVYNHGDYDMIFFASNYLTTASVGFFYQDYASDYVDVYQQNFCNFANETIDEALYSLRNAQTFEEAYNASAWMQRMIHYEAPQVVCYDNQYIQAYRTDKFDHHILYDNSRYITSPWSLLQIRQKNAEPSKYGGTLNIALGQEPSTFNIYTSTSAFVQAILDLTWPGLYDWAPDLYVYPQFGTGYTEETLPNGHQKFTFDMVQNATWSDGTPVTASDYAYSFTYAYNSGLLGNPAGVDLGNLVSATAPTDYRVVIEFSNNNIWNFYSAAVRSVIPKHVFEEIGYDGWNSWNPLFNPEDPNVVCGPYILTDFEAGEFYELTANPSWAFWPEDRVETTEPTTPTGTAPPPFDATLAIVAGAVGAAVVILVGGFVLL
ncbi:MAG: ABC transporter substrate-binding protein, partial [Promethearchaeota archaeon]